MNVGTLQIPTSSQSWNSNKAHEKEAEFLTLRLLSKHARVRLSPSPFPIDSLVGRVNYFAVARSRGWFASVTRSADNDYKIIFSTLEDLRKSTPEATEEGEKEYSPRSSLPVPKPLVPTHVSFARSDEVLLVGFNDSSVVVYDSGQLFSAANTHIEPLLQLANASGQGPIVQLLSNPGDLPNLVLILREAANANGASIEVLDASLLRVISGWKGSLTDATTPTAVSWSPKGKQLAIGMQSGDILTFLPSDVNATKQTIRCPPQVENYAVSSLYWLTNSAFYAIYIPGGSKDFEVAQKHILVIHDARLNTSTSVEFDTPYFPNPALRPPGAFAAVLRNWEPSKFLVFFSDSTSSDIGLVGCLNDGSNELWANLSLEEISTPSVPLDKDSEDTVPLSLELDTTYTKAGEDNMKPVMFVYTSDGTIQSWNISNQRGAYPGMTLVSTTASSEESTAMPPQIVAPSASVEEVAMDSDGVGAVGSSVQEQPKSGFGQFAAPSFGTSTFGQPSVAPAQPSPFPAKSGFGAFASTTSSFGSPSFGFNSFSSQTPSNFGSSAPLSSTSLAAPTPPESAASPEADMVDADNESSIGGLSLGSSNTASSGDRTNTMFGAFGTPPVTSTQPAAGFGGTAIQPAKGFGAFGGGSSSFSKPSGGIGAFSNLGSNATNAGSASQSSTTAPAFGSSGSTAFGQSTFGQPSFGQSSFGAPSFGKPGFGAPSAPSTTSSSPFSMPNTSKGFGAFAQGGSSTFGSVAKPNPTPSISMATSSDDERTQASFSAQQSNQSVFGTPPPKSMFESQGAPAASSDGSKPDTLAGDQKGQVAEGTTTGTNSAFLTPTSAPAMPISPMSSPEGSPSREGRPDKADLLTQESPSDEAKKAGVQGPPPASTTPFGSPSPSPFKTSQPSAGFGAFGNIASQPSFKPAEGFGVFGNVSTQSSPFKSAGGFGGFGSTAPSSSPFSNPKPATVSAFGSSSAFGPGGSGTPAPSTNPGSTTPTFGSPSAVGSGPVFGKSTFGSPSFGAPTTPTKTPPSSGGAFSAFGGSSAGFGAFAGGRTASFADAAKAKKDEGKDEVSPLKPTIAPKESEERSGLRIKAQEIPEPPEEDLPPTPSSHGTFDDEPEVRDSLTESGFVVERSDEEDNGDEEDEDEGDDAGRGGGEEGFLSDSFSEESEEEEEDSDADAEEATPAPPAIDEAVDSTSQSKDPEARPKDLVKSPTKPLSAFGFKKPSEGTEKSTSVSGAEVTEGNVFGTGVFSVKPADRAFDARDEKAPSTTIPFGKITGPKSPSPTFSFGQAKPTAGSSIFGDPEKPSGVQEQLTPLPATTTPPGSPDKDGQGSSIISPKPVTASNMASLGIGRPSSRPVKSSPLSGAPLTSAESVPSSVSTSAPLLPKARPASPKMPFGQLPTLPAKAESTPPSFGAQPAMSQKPMPFSPSAPSTPSPSQSFPTTPFSMTPMSTPAPFKFPPTAIMPPQPPVLNSIDAGNAPFIMPSTPPVIPPATVPSPLSKSGPLSTSNLFARKPVVPPPPQQPEPQPQLQLQTRFDSAMQEDCQTLCLLMAKEFESLKKLGADATMFRERASRPALPKHSKSDLGDLTKWSMGDLDIFGKTVKSLESDILALYEFQNTMKPLMREVESNLLKAETRKEEIVRFSKAKADPEFARMLKARTLGPEHAETQNQLRKQIRTSNERVEQLEIHLKACKKKLEEERKGRPNIQPPSLDTVNRTYRNIDLAIEDQTERIATLVSRVAKLNLSPLETGSFHSPARRNTRGRFSLNDDDDDDGHSATSNDGKRSWSGHALYRPDVTPSIAASTAAALNAERSAQRLKLALSRARTAPLLNTQAVEPALPAPSLDNLQRSLASSSGQLASVSFPTNDSLEFDDLDSDAAQASSAELRTARQRKSSHQKSVQLGRTHQRVPSTITSFDWGPMPAPKPMTQLSSDLRADRR